MRPYDCNGGRPPKLTDEDRKYIRDNIGRPIRLLAKQLKVSHTVIYSYLKKTSIMPVRNNQASLHIKTVHHHKGFNIDMYTYADTTSYHIRRDGVTFAPAPGSVAAAKRIIDTYLKSVNK